jgi:hypothetical protein
MVSERPASASDPVAHWRQRLRGVSLPAVSDAAAWTALQDEVEDLDAAHELIARDLPLALALLVEAQRSPRIAANASGLQHVLRLLGSNGIRTRLRDWSHGWIEPRQPAQRLVLQALANSRLACLFLQRWMHHSLVADADARLWMTALLGVARWKLPLLDMRLALEIERRVSLGERRQRVERALLGCSMEVLGTLHLVDLGFADAGLLATRVALSPRLIASAARRARHNALPEALPSALARQLREPLVGCGLAYALALETQRDWYSARCQRLIHAAATCLNRPVSGVLDDLHRAALMASEEDLYTRGLLAPAARLIRLPQPRLQRRRVEPRQAAAAQASRSSAQASAPAATTPTPTPTPTPASASASASASARRPVAAAPAAATPTSAPARSLPNAPSPPLAAPATAAAPAPAPKQSSEPGYLARCRERSFASLPAFLRASGGFLAEAGLGRCALFLRMKQPERLVGYYAEGFAEPGALRQISFAPADGALLQRLLRDPRGALWVQPTQVSAAISSLPPALRDWPPRGGFLLVTVQVNEAPMGFWWADRGTDAAPVDAPRFAAARQLASAFGSEFTRLIRAQRGASG